MVNPIDMRRRAFLSSAASIVCPSLATPNPAQGQTNDSPASNENVASLVLRSGKLITIDDRFTIAQAVAIRDDRIVAVGSDEQIRLYTGPHTRVLDLHGKTVIPGLIDGHAHMDRGGLKQIFPSLGRVRSIKDIQDRIAELARKSKPGEWIVTMPIGDPPFYRLSHGRPLAIAWASRVAHRTAGDWCTGPPTDKRAACESSKLATNRITGLAKPRRVALPRREDLRDLGQGDV